MLRHSLLVVDLPAEWVPLPFLLTSTTDHLAGLPVASMALLLLRITSLLQGEVPRRILYLLLFTRTGCA